MERRKKERSSVFGGGGALRSRGRMIEVHLFLDTLNTFFVYFRYTKNKEQRGNELRGGERGEGIV